MRLTPSQLLRDSLRHTLHSALGPQPVWDLQQLIWQMVGYQPTPRQAQMHRGLVPGPQGQPVRAKRKAASGGIQSGKSKWTAAEILSLVPWVAPAPIYIVGPDFDQSRHEMRYLFDWLTQLGWLDPNDASMPNSKADAWIFPTQFGTRIQTYTAMMPAKIAGESPGVIAMVEAGQQSVETYHICRTRAVPGDAWLLINGTIERSKEDWYFNLLDQWQQHPSLQGVAYELPSWSNTAVFPGGRTDPKILEVEHDPTVPRKVFLARFAGQRPQPEGLVFASFEVLQHVRPIHLGQPCADCEDWHVILPKDVPMELWIDPGQHLSAVLAVAVHDRKTYVVDALCERGWRPSHFIQAARQQPWWPNVERGGSAVMDIYGKQVHGEWTWAEMFRAPAHEGGAGLEVFMQKVDLLEGIERVRDQLQPDRFGAARLVVDPRCTHLIWELTHGYRHLTDVTGTPIGHKPLDRDNDACKALTYGIMARFGPVPNRTQKAKKPPKVLAWRQHRPRPYDGTALSRG